MLLHLSDLHFGVEHNTVVDALAALCRTLPLEAIAISGDLTQRARHREFLAFHHFMQGLGVPWLVVPGNHDIPLYHLPRRVFNPFGHYEHVFGPVEQTLDTPHFHLVGVNSIHPKHHTRGRLTASQILETGARLRAGAAGKHRLILSHQPFRVLRPEQLRDVPSLVLPAVKHWADCGLDAVLHGHFHVPVVLPLQHHFGLSKEVLDIQAGTAISHRLRHDTANSVNIIHADLRVERFDYSFAHSRFESVQQLWPIAHTAHDAANHHRHLATAHPTHL